MRVSGQGVSVHLSLTCHTDGDATPIPARRRPPSPPPAAPRPCAEAVTRPVLHAPDLRSVVSVTEVAQRGAGRADTGGFLFFLFVGRGACVPPLRLLRWFLILLDVLLWVYCFVNICTGFHCILFVFSGASFLLVCLVFAKIYSGHVYPRPFKYH